LKSLLGAIAQVNGKPGIHVFDDYILYNGIPDRYFSYENMDAEVEPGALKSIGM
jgi:hydroxyacylglutathione hydrolase